VADGLPRTIDPRLAREVERIGAAFGRAARAFEPRVRVIEEGRVQSVGDGVMSVSGLPGVGAEELLRVGPVRALVLGLEPDRVEAVILDDAHAVRRGEQVRATGRRASLAVGGELLGRVIDPLGRPRDGRPLRLRGAEMALERRAPAIHERAAVHRSLYTGVLAIDAMFPIGRGQRELLLGDEGTGKTSIGLDVLLRQASTDVVGVYVAVGRRRAETWHAVDALREAGGRWVVVVAPEDVSPGMRYLAPYAGCAVAEYFMDRGEHALVVYDDLTSHAVAWRELALLLRRPPGREAFPGDVFYLHSRLLERATQLSPERGGGSLTALPVARLEAGRLSAYLPTNLISITDGQVVLSQALFAAGQLPAIDAGLSVSRVGGKAQPQVFRELAGRLRLEYASFLELEAFSRIGARLEETVERRLARGRRLRALLRQPRLAPYGVFAELVQLILAADLERLMRIPEDAVSETAARLVDEVRHLEPSLARRIDGEAHVSSEDRDTLARAVAAVIDRLHPAGAGGGS
jgi:F-type H+-transporting ATPase subunit alpha